MPVLNVTLRSQVLGMDCGANIILPLFSPENPAEIKKPFKTLYLLHGLGDDQTAWTRYTSIERYAANYGVAVVMPCGHRSFYSDRKNGGQYFKFISEELIEIMQELFPLSDKREDRYAAGLSMGGYGAMKLGLSCPEKFAAAASLSGALDIFGRLEKTDYLQDEFGFILKLEGEEREKLDLFYLSEKLSNSENLRPKIYMCCGTEDFLYEDNIKFREHLNKINLDFVYEESEGDHVWSYWDLKIQSVLEFMFGRGNS